MKFVILLLYECIFTIKQIQKTKINTITRARSHKNMTLTTHTCKGIQTLRQILGKNFTSWVNSRQRAQEDKDKQMQKYTDTHTKNTKTHLFQVRTQPHTLISHKNLTSWVNSRQRAQEERINICIHTQTHKHTYKEYN